MRKSGVCSINHRFTSTISTTGTGRPISSAKRVPNQSFTSTRSVLGIVLELHDIVVTVGAAHKVALRTAAHSANVLNRLYRHGSVPWKWTTVKSVVQCCGN